MISELLSPRAAILHCDATPTSQRSTRHRFDGRLRATAISRRREKVLTPIETQPARTIMHHTYCRTATGLAFDVMRCECRRSNSLFFISHKIFRFIY